MLATVFAVTIVLGCTPGPFAETQLSYYIAAETKPIEGEPTPDGGIPTGDDWVSDTYITPIGVHVPLVRRRVPELTFSMDEVERVTLEASPMARALFPSSTTVHATLIVAAQLVAKLDALGQQYRGYCVLVRSGDRLLGCMPVFADLFHSAVSGGVFASEEDAREFYKQIEGRIVVKGYSTDEERQWRRYYEKFAVAMSWRLKCDSEFQGGLEGDGYDPSELKREIERLGNIGEEPDCSDKPPELPTSPSVQ